jgi:hypothetical protein
MRLLILAAVFTLAACTPGPHWANADPPCVQPIWPWSDTPPPKPKPAKSAKVYDSVSSSGGVIYLGYGYGYSGDGFHYLESGSVIACQDGHRYRWTP